ncbi:MAG: NAD(P)/FAD-dependent oxidoreductase [Pseudomonadota bacterium]
MGVTGSANIVVVGGGAAGLAAAVAAEAAGFTCQVLEAQGHLGGRVRTVPLGPDGAFDEGAQMVNGDMTDVLDLAREAKADLTPLPRNGASLCLVDGEPLRMEQLIGIDELYDLLDDQVVRWDSVSEVLRALRLTLKWWTTPWDSVGEAQRGVRHFVDDDAAPPNSLAAALKALLLCEEDHALATAYFTESYAAAPETIDAHALRDLFSRYRSDRDDVEFQIAGGLGPIVDHLAGHLAHAPALNTPVTRVHAGPHHVEVHTNAGVWHADHVIVAVPPTVARAIAFDDRTHGRLAPLFDAFQNGAMIKTALVYDSPFWRLQGLSGTAVFADCPGLTVIDGSPGDGGRPRLIAFQGGPLAKAWAALPPDQRQAALFTHLSKVFGPKAATPSAVADAVWVDHPWCGGGYNATVRVGGDRDALANLAAVDGRIRFAGAELDDAFWGYVEGAIRSGRRATASIIAAPDVKAA